MTRLPAAIAVGAIVLAACSSGSAPPTQSTSPAAGTTTIDLSDFRFAPAAVTIQAGTTAEINLRNSGSVLHNWTVLTDEITTETDFEESMVLFTAEAVAGAQNRLTFESPPAGVYQVICTIPTHFGLGMVGSLTVE